MIRPQRSYAPATCAWCVGTAKRAVSSGFIMSCLVCGGKGDVLVPQPAQQCPQCEGGGKRNVTNACLTCAGTGLGACVAQGSENRMTSLIE